ncbi:VTT domain-containing protein [Dehalococcoidia bacterium]|nr:VTT domain-containing protein [Dehalococcoidia bacterium]MCL0079491.1 VTT domain-containing protein [Dehalococcoidia bacterium]MCL0096965.1 VTT domain-containing protein [Dehalococcoidia bacterium]
MNFLRRKVIRGKGLLVLGILCILVLSFIVYQLDIDWEELVREHGFVGIFILMLVTSMTILFPLPGWAVLVAAPGIMGLSGGGIFWLAVVATTGATLGEATGYLAGYCGRVMIPEKHRKNYEKIQRLMRSYGSKGIFIVAMMPFPFDLVGIASGALRFPLWKFLVYSWPGRMIRTVVLVHLGWGIFEILAKVF